MKLMSCCLVLACSLLVGCAGGLPASSIPDVITAERAGFIPEGIEYDNSNGRFLIGSIADGSIYAVSNSGALTEVVSDDELIASVGIEVDEPRNRLLVANSDNFAQPSTPTGAAMLGVYDLDSGEQLAMVDLAASIENPPSDRGHFANDVAVSAAGTAFVTDSQMNIVYQVDIYYKAKVLLDLGRDSGFNINGIEYHPAGYLILASPGTAGLIKVPVNSPHRWSVVELDVPATGSDGLVWASDGGLVSTSNNSSAVMKYHSDDNWRSARLTGMASFPGQATTAAVVGDDVFVIQPHFADDGAPQILRAKF